MSTDAYLRSVQAAESPTGVDNRMGSGAYSKFQFMPATATAYAQRTPWGRGLTADQVKAAVASDEIKAAELAKMFTQDNEGVLARAGMPVNAGNRFALHRFGPAGGMSLLRADGAMPVADWVRSVNWGQGVSPDAVIRQNGLGRYFNVGDLRNRFINGQIGGVVQNPGTSPVTSEESLPATPAPTAPIQTAFIPPMPSLTDALGRLFTNEEPKRKKGTRERERLRREALFAEGEG